MDGWAYGGMFCIWGVAWCVIHVTCEAARLDDGACAGLGGVRLGVVTYLRRGTGWWVVIACVLMSGRYRHMPRAGR